MKTLFSRLKCVLFNSSRKKIKPENIDNTLTTNNIEDYNEITKKIRKCTKLSQNEIDFLSRLPRENWIDIINLYNIHMINFELFSEYHSVINTNNC
jgi:hypothetical protein